MRHKEPRTVRLWVWWNQGWVKISIGPNLPVRMSYSVPTDEGWASESAEFEYDREWGVVTGRWVDDGADCDGRLTRHYEATFNVNDESYKNHRRWDGGQELIPDEFRIAWRNAVAGQRDYTAEAAGY